MQRANRPPDRRDWINRRRPRIDFILAYSARPRARQIGDLWNKPARRGFNYASWSVCSVRCGGKNAKVFHFLHRSRSNGCECGICADGADQNRRFHEGKSPDQRRRDDALCFRQRFRRQIGLPSLFAASAIKFEFSFVTWNSRVPNST
jgi:hypothetical protein